MTLQVLPDDIAGLSSSYVAAGALFRARPSLLPAPHTLHVHWVKHHVSVSFAELWRPSYYPVCKYVRWFRGFELNVLQTAEHISMETD